MNRWDRLQNALALEVVAHIGASGLQRKLDAVEHKAFSDALRIFALARTCARQRAAEHGLVMRQFVRLPGWYRLIVGGDSQHLVSSSVPYATPDEAARFVIGTSGRRRLRRSMHMIEAATVYCWNLANPPAQPG